MSPASPEYWAVLGGTLWKIFQGVVLPMAVIYGLVCLAMWLLKKAGVLDL
jgi:hypothetical protein